MKKQPEKICFVDVCSDFINVASTWPEPYRSEALNFIAQQKQARDWEADEAFNEWLSDQQPGQRKPTP
jgi:hypothetical protein